jgi:hypothetical protein
LINALPALFSLRHGIDWPLCIQAYGLDAEEESPPAHRECGVPEAKTQLKERRGRVETEKCIDCRGSGADGIPGQAICAFFLKELLDKPVRHSYNSE